MIYLISLTDAVHIPHIPQEFYAEGWANRNPDYPDGAWITEETLRGLWNISIEPAIRAEHPSLPVFHGFSFIDTCQYTDALSAIVMASPEGPYARGISYIGYNCEAQIPLEEWCDNGDLFFYYSRREDRLFLWRVVEEEVGWLINDLWHGDPNFQAWVATL